MTYALAAIVTPTVIAAIVSAVALIVREHVTGKAGDRQHRRDGGHRAQELMLRQIESLWRENAESKSREAALRVRLSDLEQRLTECGRTIRKLEAELDRVRTRLER